MANGPTLAIVIAMRSLLRTVGLAAVALALSFPAAAQLDSKSSDPLSKPFGEAPKLPKSAFGALVIEAEPNKILKRNLEAAAVIYAAAALEEMQLFAVADRVAAQFASGMLPVSTGAGDALYRYTRTRSQRLSEQERRRMYGHVFGGGRSTGGVAPNREFTTLFMRFLTAVSKYERGKTIGKKMSASASRVHKAGRDLATNLSNRSYGAPVFAAASLARQQRDIEKMLSHPEVLKAYQVGSVWKLVEQVAKRDLGKSANTAHHRTRAQSGAAIIKWLGSVAAPLASSGGAAQVARSLSRARVPAKVRRLNRVLSPKHKLVTTQPSSSSLKVRALCFDKKRRLVACRVKLK